MGDVSMTRNTARATRAHKRWMALALPLVLGIGIVGVPATSAAADEAPAPETVAEAPAPELGDSIMGDYDPSAFVAQAKELDAGLVDALKRDLGVSAEEYLAEAAAANDASDVTDDLVAQGVDVLDTQLSGDTLTVYLGETADAAVVDAVEATGATAVIGAPPVADLPTEFEPLAASTLYGGQGYYYETGAYGYTCSVGFNGFSAAGARQFVTAGHCVSGKPGTPIYPLNLPKAGASPTSSTIGAPVGSPLMSSFKFGGNVDAGLVSITDAAAVAATSVLNYGGGKGAPLASTPIRVTDTSNAVVGAPLCKSGVTTGWSCGRVLATDTVISVGASTVNAVLATTCADHGDSGGAAMIGTAAVGLTSAGPVTPCGSANYATAFFPMTSAKGAANVRGTYGSTWEPAVSVVAKPVVASPAPGAKTLSTSSLTGTVAGANSRNYVRVQFAGESKPRTATVAANGTWSIPLSGLAEGTRAYTASVGWGTRSFGPTVSGSVSVVAPPTVGRISGDDRFATSAAISKAAFPGTAPVVYVTTGMNYPDALSAAPAAVKEGAPLLLVSGSLPASVKAEIQRLSPNEVVVVGGASAVSENVVTAIKKVAKKVTRVAGGDRYQTSRMITDRAFPGKTPSVYVATGGNFPDALSASAVAAGVKAPVLLVPGGNGAVDATTTKYLSGKGVTSAVVAGGASAVSAGIVTQLGKLPGVKVTRVSGSDRFATSEALNKRSFSTAPTAYFATGMSFPDALAGAALAGKGTAPLFVVQAGCVPASVVADLASFSTRKVTLLGGTNALAAPVASLSVCR